MESACTLPVWDLLWRHHQDTTYGTATQGSCWLLQRLLCVAQARIAVAPADLLAGHQILKKLDPVDARELDAAHSTTVPMESLQENEQHTHLKILAERPD